ncbi:MAG TPA: hypothetical protein VHH15_12085 [Actinophytocola sp.]|nr:hypothetical protein [Actinophytocola sp.]
MPGVGGLHGHVESTPVLDSAVPQAATRTPHRHAGGIVEDIVTTYPG